MMKKLYAVLIILPILGGCKSNYQHEIYKEKPAFYSYIFGNVNDNEIKAEYNADVYATPASCQKIITTLLAYKTLGPEYQYTTTLYAVNKNSKIQDAIIEFSGDPTLTSEDLYKLLEPLQNKKIRKIILDRSVFQTPLYSPNIMFGDIGTKFAGPISAITIDKNLINIVVEPSSIEGVVLKHDSDLFIKTSITTTLEPHSVKLAWKEGQLQASGNIKPSDDPLEIQVSPIEFDKYVLHKLSIIMMNLNIKGDVVITTSKPVLSDSAILVNTVKSKPLKDIIPAALKKSDNLIFDNLYLKVLHSQTPYSLDDWREGDKITKELINKYFNVDMSKALFVDGSGLSRYNVVQPKKLFEVLKQAYNHQEFIAALAKPGEENSTLEKRGTLPSNLRAKTGEMSGISCLCGYSLSDIKPKAFVVIANSFSNPREEILVAIDKIVNHNLKGYQ